MVIDTSALIAILLNESESDIFVDAISADPVRLMSAVNALETAIVIEARKREAGGREFDLLLHRAGIDIVAFTQEQLEEARSVWRRYGKGNHPAGLNLCDCCAYALSATSGEPLLFKGNDFSRTDALPACPLPEKSAVASFHLIIQKTCHRQGFFNVPATFDGYLGVHNAAIEIFIEGTATPIQGVINRTATRNGTPRILGHAALRHQFQARFSVGATVIVEIESPQRIRIRPR
jgi:ribonuclease VapC